jgi:choline-sulfatase
VGAYGYASGDTKTLDRLAREGVLLEDAVVQVPQTRPSHVSIFTGRYPYEHGVRDNYAAPLGPTVPTLASLVRKQGYTTAAFIGAYPVARSSGLDQGFSSFDDPYGSGEASTIDDPRLERPAGQVIDAALAWLGRRPPGPFFMWVHLFDPHHPYLPPEPYRQRFAKSLYDGEVAYADAQLGRLLAWLDAQGLRQQTLVVVTSDHGEGLGDHGEDQHLLFLYDSTLKVPALFSWPGRLPTGARVKGQFRSVDFVSTALDLLGLQGAVTSGTSRAEALRTGARIADNESYAESLYGQLHFGWAPLRALRGEGWKYIDAPRPELYRLADDAGELHNLVEARPPVVAGMRSRLTTYDKGGQAAPHATAPGDPSAAERLAALGYVGGGFFVGRPSGADPKDKIAEYQTYQQETVRALRLYRDRDLDGALRVLEPLSRRSSVTETGETAELRSFNVEYTLGRALLDKKRFAEAVPHLQEAIRLLPTAVPAYLYLAQAFGGSKRLTDARGAIDRGLESSPGNPQLLQARGSLDLRLGDLGAARATLEKAKAADSSNVLVRVDLAAAYRQSGDLAMARSEAEEAVRMEPKSAEARVAQGLVRAASGQAESAAEAFREALKLSPDQPDALYYLATIAMAEGRPGEAAALLGRLVSRAPAYPDAAKALTEARRAAAQGPVASSATPPTSVKPRAGATVRLLLLRVRGKEEAAELVQKLTAGEDFSALARAHSVDPSAALGGDLGMVALADLGEPVRSTAARLAPGETSAPVLTSTGWVLLRRVP